MSRSTAFSIPNLITMARIAAIIPVAALLMADSEPLRWLAIVLFILAAASDWLDGYLARRWNQVSPLGRMLDPIADKMLVGIVIAILAWDGGFSALDMVPVIAILFREFFISGLREFLGNSAVVLPVSQLAKWKTTVQLVAFIVVMAEPLLPAIALLGDVLLWLAGILTLWTGLDYLRAAWPHLDPS